MPLSNPWHLSVILHFAAALKPKKVLDVGVGMGAYGFMFRQYLDIAHERLSPSSWQLTIDGIEIFEPYRNPVWGFAYNKIALGDARTLVPASGHYDLIVCNDVLEHFPKDQALRLADEMLNHAPVVIITTPNRECPQGEWGGNPAETHHCLLAGKDFPDLVLKIETTMTSVFILSRDPEKIPVLLAAQANCPLVVPAAKPALARRIIFKMLRILKVSKKEPGKGSPFS